MAYKYKGYTESDAVQQLRDQLAQVQGKKPGEYQSQWTEKQQQAANDYMNRPDFQYNMSSDPLYQQYKELYQRQGKLAMKDTIGQAAAMNGGYGSSYGQMAGQQMYDSKLQQLNDRVPELYNLALSKYQADGEQLLNRFNLASSMEGQDYNRYQDALSAWQNERDYATNRYDNERTTDYNLWADQDNREYSRYKDTRTQAQKQVEYLLSIGITPGDSLLKKAGYSKQYVKQKAKQNKPADDAAAMLAMIRSGGGGGGAYYGGGNTTKAKYEGVGDLGRGPISLDTLAGLVASGDVDAKLKDGVIKVKNNTDPNRKTPGTPNKKLPYTNPLSLLTKKFR